MTTAPSGPLILYVDDDKDDFYFFQESLADSGYYANLVSASNGEEAFHYLESALPAELPSLIILDLNMPRWDGRQTLHHLKQHPEFASIPVVILSTSENKSDRETCSSLGALDYIQKPNHFDGYRSIIHNFMNLIKNGVKGSESEKSTTLASISRNSNTI